MTDCPHLVPALSSFWHRLMSIKRHGPFEATFWRVSSLWCFWVFSPLPHLVTIYADDPNAHGSYAFFTPGTVPPRPSVDSRFHLQEVLRLYERSRAIT